VADAINRGRNEAYLPELALPKTVRATTDPGEALERGDVVVLAVPSQTLRANLSDWGASIPSGAPVVSLMKGVELGTTLRMSEVIAEAADVEARRVVVVSGPNLAPEIARRQPAAGVVACTDMETAERVASACATPYFRPYTDTDVIGAEVCGATKNVVALASGMAEGMGFGDNTKATIITRGLAETTRLGLALGAHPQTFMGLAGVGDLIATCMSPLSRNHSFGVRLGRGMTVDEATAELRTTTEGVKSCQSILTLAEQHDVVMPICEQVVAVIRDGHSASEVGPRLMSRDLKAEKH
jgi:glycerol-3-phosphate dehydrogenase (NAD(P)+)